MGRGWKSLETHDTLSWTPLLRRDVARVGGGQLPSVCQPEVCNTLWSLERVGCLSEQRDQPRPKEQWGEWTGIRECKVDLLDYF